MSISRAGVGCLLLMIRVEMVFFFHKSVFMIKLFDLKIYGCMHAWTSLVAVAHTDRYPSSNQVQLKIP